jgi:hypothetical protein
VRLLHKHHLLPDRDAFRSLVPCGRRVAAHLAAAVLPQLALVPGPVPPAVTLEASVALSLALALGWPVLPPASSAEDPTGSDPTGSLLAAILDPRPTPGSLLSRGASLHQRLRGDVNGHLLQPTVLPAVAAFLLAASRQPAGLAVFEELAAQVLACGGLASGGVGPRGFLEAAAPHLAALAPPPGASVAALRTLLGCCEQVGWLSNAHARLCPRVGLSWDVLRFDSRRLICHFVKLPGLLPANYQH